MTTVRTPTAADALSQDRFVFYDVDWHFYETILEKVGNRNVRVTYDGKDLEIMSPRPEHESWKCIIRRLIESLSDALNIPIVGRGSTTLKRRKKRKGLEPDQCYYVQNQARIRKATQPNLRFDPAPDLAVEIDVTSWSVERQPVYAALGVPEIWRYDGENLTALQLQPDGQYMAREFSLAFPFLRVADLEPFVRKGESTDHMTLSREFRAWVLKKFPEHLRP